MTTTLLRIGGTTRPASNGATFERRNPISGDVVSRAAAATPGDAEAAVDAASAAFPVWSSFGPNRKRAVLLTAADLIQAKAARFSELTALETGATAGWGAFNAGLAAGMLREAASLTTQVTGQVIPSDHPGSLAFSVREPAGVVLGIAPWNAAVILAVRVMATPLACGNTIVFKGSEHCPATHALIVETMEEAGFPPGTINLLSNDPANAPVLVAGLIAHPAVRRVNFTGSTKVGRIVAELCGRHLKPVLLELGGKAPLLILDDADLDAAVDAAAFGAFMNQGQVCMSTERIIVDDAVADEFVARFARKAATLSVGDPRAGNVVLGSLLSHPAVTHVQALVDDARTAGATVVLEPQVTHNTVVSPGIVDRVTPAMRLYAEESFGPVVAVIRVKGDDQAVQVANDSDYGLSAAVFSRNINRALIVASKLSSGMCHINGATVHDEAQMPFGGTKASGIGRFGGTAGIAEFTDLRWITIATTPPHYPF